MRPSHHRDVAEDLHARAGPVSRPQAAYLLQIMTLLTTASIAPDATIQRWMTVGVC